MSEHTHSNADTDLAQSSSALVGAEVGDDFVVERLLAEGGMGAVYVALQRSTGVRRALKVMRAETAGRPGNEARERFRREAALAATVASDHVVKVLTAGHDSKLHLDYLVMELLRGASLARVIERLAPLGTSITATLLSHVAHALGAAGDVGIVHRDVKPENIFLVTAMNADTPFAAKLLDFGVAKNLGTSSAARTQAVGTPYWLAPEQTESAPQLSRSTDVWPLGLVAFACLVGRPFWATASNPETATPAAFLRELLVEEIPRATTRAGDRANLLPAGFDAWFARCVARDPTARFSDAREAARAFVALGAPLSKGQDTNIAERLIAFLGAEADQSSAFYIGFEATVATPSAQGVARAVSASLRSTPAIPVFDGEDIVPVRQSSKAAWVLGTIAAVAGIFLVGRALSPPDPTPRAPAARVRREGLRAGTYKCRLSEADDFRVPCTFTGTAPGRLETTVRAGLTTCFVAVTLGETPTATGFCNRESGMGPTTSDIHGTVFSPEAETYVVTQPSTADADPDSAYFGFRGPIAQ